MKKRWGKLIANIVAVSLVIGQTSFVEVFAADNDDGTVCIEETEQTVSSCDAENEAEYFENGLEEETSEELTVKGTG